MKKTLLVIIFILTLVIVNISSITYASTNLTKLNVIEKASETKNLENNQGYISKQIVDSNPEEGEVTIEIKISNTKKDIAVNGNTEIFLVIDNSGSMDFKTAEGQTRKSILLNSAKKFVETIFKDSANTKVGIIKFRGEHGLWNWGDAGKIITDLTSDKEEVLSGIETLENAATESGTNIQNGLVKAEENFSEDAGNKIIVLLTDGCPNEDAEDAVSNDEMIMTNETYLKILNSTKNELIKANKNGIVVISLMTGVDSNDVDSSGNIITSTEDDKKAIETIFGTEENPTVGKFYNAKTTDVEEVIDNSITKDVQNIINSPINNVKISDYFPSDITENFEFSYVGEPSKGTVTDSINPQTNTITWDIGTLKGNEVATIRYKLKIKDMNNEELLNKEISTNEKVVLTYTDSQEKGYEVILDSSPKIKIEEVQEQTQDVTDNAAKEDTTIANKILPNTGISKIIILSIVALTVTGIYMFIKYKNIKLK